jgi:hypothetical protein
MWLPINPAPPVIRIRIFSPCFEEDEELGRGEGAERLKGVKEVKGMNGVKGL